MSRQIGSLHRSFSHPANVQNPIPIIPLFAFPPSDSPHLNRSSGIYSEANSNNAVFNTISQFNNSDIETPDELANSEPSRSKFSQPPLSTHSLPIQKMIPLLPFPMFPKQPHNTPPLPMNVPTIVFNSILNINPFIMHY